MSTLANIIESVLMKAESTTGDSDIYGTIYMPAPSYSKNTTAWNADTTTIIPNGEYAVNTTNGQYKRGDGVSLWASLSYITGWTVTGIDSTATEFIISGASYADGSGFSTGIIEVGTELIYIQDIDRTTGLVSNAMRAWRGTSAITHNAGTRVRNNPRLPVSLVMEEINNTINSVYPRLQAVKTVELTIQGSRIQYDMPADAIQVLSIQYLTTGASKAWRPVTHWSFDNFAGSNSASSKTVNIGGGLSGRKVQITYIAEPVNFTSYVEDYSITGLPSWSEEVIKLGTLWRLASFMDSAKVAQTSAEQQLINNLNNANAGGGSATTLAKYFLGMFEQQLTAANIRQSKELPIQSHKLI